ncbi:MULTISPECIES: peptide deformylase [unclassified Brenneria]|uniref:peptide deformylase n=1 Tax=unclassified Brenneria TaxID=2634434 RepID=UPI001551AD5A|nr:MULTISPECIES: peptide deformylase [unclassified Brenneria]MBJ7222860.1 peptide deformylase [Brenneria sp. L3-3C-1]MEE3644099.1 peptide deformylase [Brenneria sp. L3_3C_1]MEE3651796.1 peptide deformylase [Brenneria sp. HEZEL_4_2_4]NPD01752.1 peptide deformylase [Brenneria sp. hezel4-2-4]
MDATDVLWIDDRRMNQVSRDVETIDDNVKAVVARMFAVIDAMKDSGLAAIQLGIPQRIVAIDMADEQGKRQRLALINPQITQYSEEKTAHLELCSSIPDHPMPAERAKRVTVSFFDLDGAKQEIEAGGELAVCLQHEIDHLDGRSLIDNLSGLKRGRLMTQLAKLRRKTLSRE